MIEKLRAYLERHITVDDVFWSELVKTAEQIIVKKKEVLIPLNSNFNHLYIVTSGSFETALITSDGESKTVWFHMEDLFEVVVSMDSFFLDERTKYEISALENSVVYKIKKEAIDSWLLKYASFNTFYREDVVSAFIKLNEIRNHMVSHTPPEFLTYLKQYYPKIFERIPENRIAQFIGITPEWYSKLKSKMLS
ncbi:MAG: cyclic nucleotide-binding domain-containing protein [Bacteroidota bacterium]